ncbi:hypothetical protein SK571_26620 [Lentzea sp. BCCO 10_0798]|uniref:Uncharacterized protein n=1 Tax=Lentzea kristufekii TaxID=3095430 RepID=A0ABU4TYU6_9PSEU|nr:hypothetical protein [Lentzea sp. BCCO 10_0798]MDX8052966.1 hypothetical protein [Lentzea sp. BCCO 10_0798]
MSDADVVDQVLGLVRSHEDWTKAGLAGAVQDLDLGGVTSSVDEVEGTIVRELTFELWELDLDDEEHRDYEQLEALARPRMDALRELFEHRAEGWRPGAISVAELDEWYPYGYVAGWHTAARSVQIGCAVHDNGLPLMVQLRAYDVTA